VNRLSAFSRQSSKPILSIERYTYFVIMPRTTEMQLLKKYLERSKIKLYFLPPYSPNLNPIERLWKWMKERVIYNTYYREFEDFRAAVLGFFKVLEGLDHESILGKCFRSRVRDKFRPLGAPVTNF
jgi:transposase